MIATEEWITPLGSAVSSFWNYEKKILKFYGRNWEAWLIQFLVLYMIFEMGMASWFNVPLTMLMMGIFLKKFDPGLADICGKS